VKHTTACWLEYLIVIRGAISAVLQPEVVSVFYPSQRSVCWTNYLRLVRYWLIKLWL